MGGSIRGEENTVHPYAARWLHSNGWLYVHQPRIAARHAGALYPDFVAYSPLLDRLMVIEVKGRDGRASDLFMQVTRYATALAPYSPLMACAMPYNASQAHATAEMCQAEGWVFLPLPMDARSREYVLCGHDGRYYIMHYASSLKTVFERVEQKTRASLLAHILDLQACDYPPLSRAALLGRITP